MRPLPSQAGTEAVAGGNEGSGGAWPQAHSAHVARRNARTRASGRYPDSRMLKVQIELPEACGAFPGGYPVAAVPLALRQPLRGQCRHGARLQDLLAPASRLTQRSGERWAPVARRKCSPGCDCRSRSAERAAAWRRSWYIRRAQPLQAQTACDASAGIDRLPGLASIRAMLRLLKPGLRPTATNQE